MKVEYAPLITGASGRMAGIVATRWKGIPIMRRFTPPAQPRTPTQVQVRNRFRNANKLYPVGSPVFRQSWMQYAEGRAAIARNGFIAAMGAIPNSDTTLANLAPLYQDGRYPGVTEVTMTGGSGSIAFTDTAVFVPAGFTPANFEVVIIPDFDPNMDQPRSALSMQEEETAYTSGGNPGNVTLTAGDYLVAVTLSTTVTGNPTSLIGVSVIDVVTVS